LGERGRPRGKKSIDRIRKSLENAVAGAGRSGEGGHRDQREEEKRELPKEMNVTTSIARTYERDAGR